MTVETSPDDESRYTPYNTVKPPSQAQTGLEWLTLFKGNCMRRMIVGFGGGASEVRTEAAISARKLRPPSKRSLYHRPVSGPILET